MTRTKRNSRSILHGLMLAAALCLPTTLAAQSTDLPDYVVAEFGTPPTIPTGPLSCINGIDTPKKPSTMEIR